MKYLKLFEVFNSEVKFYRFNKFDILSDVEEMKLTPKQRKMVGPENVNDILVKNGFPDKQQCVHFMDQLAFRPDWKYLYGDFIYEIEIDDMSKLGWSFLFPVNDWFYKGNPFYHERNNPAIQDLLNSEYGNLEFSNGKLDEMTQYLLQYEVIGTGTLEDLKSSKFFGKQKLFVWTTDDVMVKKWNEPEKMAKDPNPYKSEPLLTSDDFLQRGVNKEQIGQFYQSEMGKRLKTIQPAGIIKPARFELKRQEAISLLDEWIKTL